MNRKYSRMLRAMFASGTALVVNCLINFFVTPYVTRTIGTSAYGFVSLSKNFQQYAFILTSALTSFATRYVAVAYHRGDRNEANEYYSTALLGDVAFATVLVLTSIPIILNLEKILRIPTEMESDVKTLMFLTAITFWVDAVGTVCSVGVFVSDSLARYGTWRALSYVAEGATLAGCYMLLKPKTFYAGIAALAAAVVLLVASISITRRKTPELSARPSSFNPRKVAILLKDGVWTALNGAGDALNTGLDLLVCNSLLSATAMGQVAIAKTFHALFPSVTNVVSQAFQPMFLKSWADKDKDRLLSEMRISMKLSGMFANVMFAGFFALGPAFYSLWIPGQNVDLIYRLTVINNLSAIPGGPMQPLYFAYVLSLKKKVPTLVTLAGGVCNVIGMYVLIEFFHAGPIAVVATTAVVMAAINFVFNPLYLTKALDLPRTTFLPDVARNALSATILCAGFWAVARIATPTTWLGLVASAVGLGTAGCAIHLAVACNEGQRKRIADMVSAKFGKRKGQGEEKE